MNKIRDNIYRTFYEETDMLNILIEKMSNTNDEDLVKCYSIEAQKRLDIIINCKSQLLKL